ncbi:MAG: SpoIIE family protein phosphatase [Planctomycetaceae bacterium]
MAVLQVVKGTCPGQLLELPGDRMVMGRHPACQIVLDNAAVSRNHAQIVESQGEWFLEDLRSRNGTMLNGERIQGRTELRNGDEIRVCELVLRFYLSAPPSTPAPTLTGVNRLVEQVTTVPDVSDAAAPAVAFPQAILAESESGTDHSSIITSVEIGTARGPRIGVRPEAKLRAVMEISQNLGGTLKANEVLPRILESLFKIFPQADRGFVVLRDAATGELKVHALRTRREDGSEPGRLSMTILKEAMSKARAILSADAASDQRFALSESIANLKIRSVMCAPLVAADGTALGAMQVDTLNNTVAFSEDDLEVLASVAAQAALALENAQLHASALRQRDLERDLDFATQVQLSFLPHERPRVAGYEFFDYYEAAQRVGGDFFDYVVLPDGRVAVGVGDVAGKGVPAALLMARLSADARYELLARKTPGDAMAALNAAFSSRGIGHRFITLEFVVLDPKNHTLTVVSAGHPPPLLRSRNGQVEPMAAKATSLPLGIKPDNVYPQTQIKIGAGDAVVLFTDGVSEAMNAAHDLYGVPRLSKLLEQAPARAELLGEAIVADVEAFCAGLPQRDDICLVVLHRLAD